VEVILKKEEGPWLFHELHVLGWVISPKSILSPLAA
jgi:hypothetical protein